MLSRAQQTASLFDHFVGTGKQRQRHGEAERLGGLEIDGKLELGRQLDRQVGGSGALEDAIDIGWYSPIEIYGVGSVGNQATGSDLDPVVENGGHAVARRERDDLIEIASRRKEDVIRSPRRRV